MKQVTHDLTGLGYWQLVQDVRSYPDMDMPLGKCIAEVCAGIDDDEVRGEMMDALWEYFTDREDY